MAKPGTVPLWDQNLAVISTPPMAQVNNGVDVGDEFPAQWLNFEFHWLGAWCAYVNGIEGESLTWTAPQTFASGIYGDAGADLELHVQPGQKVKINKQLQVQSGGLDCYGGIVENTGDIECAAGMVKAPHFAGTGSTPSVVANVAAGIGATATIAGTDVAGVVTLTTAGVPSSGVQFSVTFATPYAATPKTVILMPADSNAAGQHYTRQMFPNTVNANGFDFATNSGALTTGQIYKWSYLVVQ